MLCQHALFTREAVLVVDRLDLVHPAAVLFFHQRVSSHPGLDDFTGHHVANDLGAQAEDVGVGVLAGQFSTERVLADRGVDAVDLVGDQGAAIANPVNENASVAFALGYSQAGWVDEV